jgi:hypothetical protein
MQNNATNRRKRERIIICRGELSGERRSMGGLMLGQRFCRVQYHNIVGRPTVQKGHYDT